MVRLWHRADPSFRLPKAVAYIHLHLPESYTSPEAAVQTQLLSKLVNDALSEVTYPADLAGLHDSVRPTVAGLMVTLTGYHATLATLGQTVLDRILGFEVLPDRHEVVKEKLAKDFANVRYDQPYQYALYLLGVLTESKRWHVVDDYEAVLPGATPQQLQVRAGGRAGAWCLFCGSGQ